MARAGARAARSAGHSGANSAQYSTMARLSQIVTPRSSSTGTLPAGARRFQAGAASA